MQCLSRKLYIDSIWLTVWQVYSCKIHARTHYTSVSSIYIDIFLSFLASETYLKKIRPAASTKWPHSLHGCNVREKLLFSKSKTTRMSTRDWRLPVIGFKGVIRNNTGLVLKLTNLIYSYHFVFRICTDASVTWETSRLILLNAENMTLGPILPERQGTVSLEFH